MGPAAGADVRPREFDQTQRTCDHLFAAVVLRAGGFTFVIADLRLPIRPDGLVRQPLDLHQIVPVQRTGEVDRDQVAAHVEADVLPAVEPVHDAGDDVLAGVLLHQVEASVPVDLPVHSSVQRSRHRVDDRAVPLLHVEDLRPAERAEITGLSAALGVEGRPVEHDRPVFPGRLAVEDGRGKFTQIGLVVIEFFCYHNIT